MASSIVSKESASLADFLQLLRQRKALIALILALVVLTTLGVTAFLPIWFLGTDQDQGREARRRGEAPAGRRAAATSIPFFLQDQYKIMQARAFSIP